MEFILNNSPDLSMAEITKLLFNRNFLSDVQFHVAGKTIYAHSLELMKRSIVFQKQLVTTLGENKLIPINDASYDNVYQFVQYIYLDECTIDNSNAISLLKLAKRYKVIKLENEIVRVISDREINLNLYEYCLLENDQMLLPWAKRLIALKFNECLSSNEFLRIHPVVVEDILKSEYSKVPEFKMFSAVAQWIDRNSNDNQIELHRQRDHYDNLFRLIRFPVMSKEELHKCTSKYPHLFKDSDLLSFFRDTNKLWNTQKRTKHPYQYIQQYGNIKTIFTVCQEMLFIGLRFGSEINNASALVTISETNIDTINTIKIKCPGRLDNASYYLSLGESIQLQPKMQYSIEIDFGLVQNLQLSHRPKNVDLFTNIPRSLIQFTQECTNVYEMFFKLND